MERRHFTWVGPRALASGHHCRCIVLYICVFVYRRVALAAPQSIQYFHNQLSPVFTCKNLINYSIVVCDLNELKKSTCIEIRESLEARSCWIEDPSPYQLTSARTVVHRYFPAHDHIVPDAMIRRTKGHRSSTRLHMGQLSLHDIQPRAGVD